MPESKVVNKTLARTETLLRILADGQFHSGESIAEQLKVSRTAIWKLVQKISSWQVEVYSVRGRGYRIPGGLDLLEQNVINKRLREANTIFQQLDVLTTTDSTANHVAQQWKQFPGVARVCIAEHQTAGRGRKGRAWVSPFAANLYFSIGVELPLGLSALGGISLAVGMSLTDTLNRFAGDRIRIKWPNDLLVENRKLAGILVEASGDSTDSSFLNIGIGINWNMQPKQGQLIDQPWVNLSELVQGQISRNEIVASLLVDLDKTLTDYRQSGFGRFAESWDRLSAMYKQPVVIHRGHDKVEGVEVGIEENGALKLETSQGTQLFHSGEVSLRKRG